MRTQLKSGQTENGETRFEDKGLDHKMTRQYESECLVVKVKTPERGEEVKGNTL